MFGKFRLFMKKKLKCKYVFILLDSILRLKYRLYLLGCSKVWDMKARAPGTIATEVSEQH
jgi:hypothetical protein